MDFGDVIFFLVFVGIIISNIMKAMKKAGKQKDENKEAGKQNVKKSGWKNVLEQMLEEARKQMEQAEGDGGSPSSGKPSGWEDLMSKKEPSPEKLESLRETANAAGFPLAKGQVLKTRHLNQLLNAAAGTDDAELINISTLRSMTQAYLLVNAKS